MHTKCCAVLEKSRGKDDKIFIWDPTVILMIPVHSKIGQGMRTHCEKLENGYGKNDLIPVYLENHTFNFYLNREVKSAETNNVNDADHCPAKNCQQSGNVDGRAVRSEDQRKL